MDRNDPERSPDRGWEGWAGRRSRRMRVHARSMDPNRRARSVPLRRRGVTVPGTRAYQAYDRDTGAFCTPATFHVTSGYLVAWVP